MLRVVSSALPYVTLDQFYEVIFLPVTANMMCEKGACVTFIDESLMPYFSSLHGCAHFSIALG